jgi:vitamin B12 transporter
MPVFVRPAAHHGLIILAVYMLFPFVTTPRAVADDAPPPPATLTLDPIVISATRLPTLEREVASSVTVITADDIEKKQERTLPEILQDVPGLNLVQTGSPGGVTNIYIRGTNSNHTKVLIDGVDVSDPSSADGSFDFSQILAADIERVEVLRGPQSGLYGSDAIGGVINIITKKGSGPAQFHASLEGGSFGTFNQTVGVSGSLSRFSYVADFSHYRTTDTDVTPANLVPAGRPINPDSYDNKTYATRLGADLTDNFDVGLVARYVETSLKSTSDDFLGPEAIPTDSDNRELFTRGTAHLVSFDGVFDQTLGIGYTDYRRRVLDPNTPPLDPSFYRGDRVKVDWQGNIKLMPGQILTLGAEHQIDEIDDNSPVQAQMTNDAGFVQLQSSFSERFFNTLSLRYDDNDRFGGKATYRIAPALLMPETDTKFKASLGTGFKAPTLDQLFDSFPQFDFYANPNLKPETSLGYDLGIEQGFFDQRVQFGATYFHNDIKNLIDYNDTFTSTVNIGKATTYGVESFVSYKPSEKLTLRVDYTYTIARDDILDQPLLRRPKDKASLNGIWQVTDAATVTTTILYTGPWIDVSRSGLESGINASGYTLVNLAGSYDLGHGVTAFARLNNLLDRHYQDPVGFLHQGLGAFGGVRIALDSAAWGK